MNLRLNTTDLDMYDDTKLDYVKYKIGQNLRNFRIEMGISVDDFCCKANISKGYLYKIEAGEAKIGLTTLLKAEYILGVSHKDLIPEIEPSK